MDRPRDDQAVKCEFKWVPPAELGDWWSTIKPGLVNVADKAQGGWNPGDVFLEIAGGGAFLHIALAEKHYRGFIVTQMQESHSGKKLLIWIAHGNAEGNLMVDGIGQIREWAKGMGAVKLQFQSPRRGWEKVAKTIGFAPTMVIYESDVERNTP